MLTAIQGTGSGVDLTFDNTGDTTLTMSRMRISYYLSDDTTPPPTQATFEYDGYSQTLTIPDQFVEVSGPTFQPNGTTGQQQTVQFTNVKNNIKGDLFILSVVYTDPTGATVTSTYFVGIPD